MISQAELDEFNDRIAALGDPEDPAGWIKVAAGMLKFSTGQRTPYIQIYLVRFNPQAPGGVDIGDSHDTEELESILAELREGRVDWYGETLPLVWLSGSDADAVRTRVGW